MDSLRQHWIPRTGAGFYTLGVAAYLDLIYSSTPEADYYYRLAKSNPLIMEHLGDLLERVRLSLEKLTGSPARLEPTVAYPGVHVFEYESIAIYPNAGPIRPAVSECSVPKPVDPSRLLSFTLALRLPRAGGGLDTSDVLPSDANRLARLGRNVDLAQLSRTKPLIRHEYSVGTMAVQLKPILHRIGLIRERQRDDQRMTLQGHGILENDGWVLYW